jgi:pimeloyl-ACP methyl ester carboxylesterase
MNRWPQRTQIPSVQLLTYPGVGHLVRWEHPDGVAADGTRLSEGL